MECTWHHQAGKSHLHMRGSFSEKRIRNLKKKNPDVQAAKQQKEVSNYQLLMLFLPKKSQQWEEKQSLSEGFCLQCWGLDLTGELGPVWSSSVALRGQDVSLASSLTRLLWRPRPLSSVPEVDDNRLEFLCWLSSGRRAHLQSIDCFLNEQTWRSLLDQESWFCIYEGKTQANKER